MRHTLRLALLIVAISSTALCGAADEKKDAKKSDPAEKKALEKLTTSSTIIGKLSRVEGAQRYLTVNVAISIPVPTAASPANTLSLLQLRQQLAAERSPANRQRLLLQHLQQAGGLGGGYTIRTINKEVEIQATDEMKVRTLLLPVDFDEKGRPKKYTAKEIKELKGPDSKLPGYTADFDSLKPEQTVKIYLAKKKEPPVEKGRDKAKDKADKDADAASSEKPEAVMVVILDEPKK
jgi:hypothetical protein